MSGIAMLLGAAVMLFRRYYLGGQLILGGIGVLVLARIMVWVADHIIAISCIGVALMVSAYFLMRYAKTHAVPWLEDFMGKDLDKSGAIGDDPKEAATDG